MNDGIPKLIDTDAGRGAVEDSGDILGWIKTMISLTKQVKPLQQQMIDVVSSSMLCLPDRCV